MMNKNKWMLFMAVVVLLPVGVVAQERPKDAPITVVVKKKGKPDSVVVKVGNSRIAVIIRDTADLQALRHFDVQEVVDDLLDAAIDGDTSAMRESREYLKEVQLELIEAQEKIIREQEEVIRESEEIARKRRESGGEDELRARERQLNARLRELAARERELLDLNKRSWDMHRDFSKDEWKEILKDRIELEKDRFKGRDESDRENGCEDCDEDDRDRKPRKTTYQSFNVDFGLNNYLSGGKFVDATNAPFTVRPLGSWYVGANSVYRTRLARKFFIEWGLGGSIYNFKFQNDSLRILRDASGVQFVNDTRDADFRKSKLTAGYLQASFVPVIDFSANARKPGVLDGRGGRSFRFGVGPYAGYRILGYTKQYFRIDGDKKRDRNHDNFYLNNFRYGIRAQVGFRDTDLFFCYDLNELFLKGKGPALNAFSFGISF